MIVVLVFLISFFVSENQYKLYGTIKDSDTEIPLAGANVYFEDMSLGAAADQQGTFTCQINKLSGKHTLVVSYVGYHDSHYEIDFPLTEDKKIEIFLKESAIMMDQIVVTGTRSERMLKHTPVTTQVISKKTIKESGAVDLSEVLERVTGINVASNELGTGTSTVELQGFGSEHVLILIDGVKMIGRVRGDLDISQIPSNQIEQIEIVKGATSTLYGSEAMGGVINVVTRKPGDGFKLSAFSQYGSYGKLNSSISASSDINGWRPIASFNYRKSSGFDLDKSTDQMNGTAYDKYQTRVKISRQLDEDNTISAQLNYFNEEQSVISSEVFEDIISNSNLASRAEYKTSDLKSLDLTVGVEFSNYQHALDQKLRSSGYLREGSLTKESLFKSDLLFNFDLDTEILSQKINGGYAFESESIESDRLLDNTDKKNTLHNFFLQDEIKFSQKLTLVFGGRVDAHSAYGVETSPKFSFMISPKYNFRIRGSYGYGFRAPSFKELYLRYFNESVLYRVDGNPDLKPEKSKSLNLGTELWTDNNYHTRFNVFYNNITNLIDYKLMGNIDTLYYRSENLNNAETWGAEWDMEYYPSDWCKLGLGYYYLNSKTKYISPTTETETAPLQLKPAHRANLRLGFKFFEKVNLNVTAQFMDKKFYFDPELISFQKIWIDGYSLIHTNLSFPLMEHLNGQLGIKNITDYVNMDWGPMPGREFYAILNFDF